ncbi:MAG TPA: hypothetical protein VGK17_15075 [Propionicimonas sp.]|jgi:hypothetical protein
MRKRRATSGAVIAVGIAALLAACSDPTPRPTSTVISVAPTRDPTTTPPTSATPSVGPTTAAAEAAILQAYRGYWDAQVQVLRDPSSYADIAHSDWSEPQRFAVDKALANLVSSAQLYAKNGIANVGTPMLDPTVSNVVPGQSASIADCVDGTNWQPIYTATGKSAAAPGQAPRLVVNSTVLFYDSRWVVNDSVVDRASTC